MAPALLLLLALQGQDPVRVQARLDNEEVRAGETAVLRVEVRTEGERAQIGRFRSLPPGLELQGSRDFDQRQFSIPGGTRRFVSREFVLQARAAGRYRIPSIDVVVDGDTYSTRSLILTVTAAPVRERGELGGERADGVILRTWLDADTVFVGEQVTMEAEAMFSQDARLRLRRAPEYEAPSPSGFWVHDLPDPQRSTTRTSGSEVYEVQRFRRAFFPMAPGTYEIPPARLEYEARRGLLYAPETRELISDPLRLVVLPVPTPGPPTYTGGVGSYTVRGSLEPARVPAGEAAVLTVEVEGVGNVKTLPPPALPELDGIDVYPPSEESDMETRVAEIRGSKRFSWVLIPRQAGELEIPEIRYSFFDPEAETFETEAVRAMTLEVTPGTGTAELRPTATLRYLRTEPAGADRLAWVRSPWFAAAQSIPLALLALGLFWGRRPGRGERPVSSRSLRRRRVAGLRELEERAAEAGPGLFTDAEIFARRWLADRLGIAPSDVHRPAALVAARVGEDTASAVEALLDRLVTARYAPTPPGTEARRDILRALGRVLGRVDSEAPSIRRLRSRPRQAGSSALLGLLLLSTAASSASAERAHAGAAADWQASEQAGADTAAAQAGSDTAAAQAGSAEPDAPASWFREGVRAFDEERYTAAAEVFDRYVRLRPGDAAGWYNLGTAYHHAGHPGYAIWAWLKVPRLDPRDRDVIHNLRVADVRPELVDRVAPPLPARPTELLLLASLAWMVAGIAGGAWLLRRRTPFAATAITALLLALALGGAGLASTRDARTLIVLEPSTLRAAPLLRADPVAELAPGTGLAPVEARGDWIRARTLRGDEGWVDATVTGEV